MKPDANGALHPGHLRCEYSVNPIGIDETLPRLSWIGDSAKRAQKQTAYQILVADDLPDMARDEANLWDSGKVMTDESAHVVYAGKPLGTGRQAFWKVRVWDSQGHASGWSPVAHWEMGLLQPTDWKAAWIGMGAGKAPETTDSMEGVHWVWYPEGKPREDAPRGVRYFRAAFTVPANKPIANATLRAVADNSFVAAVNGQDVGNGEGWAAFHTLPIKDALVPGRNVVAIAATNDGGPAGLAAFITLHYTDGTTQRAVTNGDWKTDDAAHPRWNALDFDDTSWKSALVVGSLGEAPWGSVAMEGNPTAVAYLRKGFTLQNKPIRRARLYATALGVYRAILNGKRVGRDELTPGWTDYNKRIAYQTYDVTELVKPGDNALGLMLGDGWYSGYVGFGHRRNHYGDRTYAKAQLLITYSDNTTDTIVTDDSWRSSAGPILMSDLLMGETYDARKELTGWTTPAFNTAQWKPVMFIAPANSAEVTDHPVQAPSPFVAPLVAQVGPTAQAVMELKPKSVTEKPAGAFVFDLGQNMVGWARLRVQAPAGTRITLRFAEILNPDGTIYTTNLRSAAATEQYVCKGGGVEIYEPTFTFHGFRYVEVTGWPGGKPPMDAITGLVVRSNTPQTGTFACSNPMVNQLQHNIQWGQMGNYLEVPTDCPQRDERLGWMGDAQIFVRTGCFNFDIAGFMTKWMQDVADAQSPEGAFPDVSPRLVDPSDGAPAWGDAGIIVPWTIYQCYGDTRILEKHYAAMAGWIDYIRSANPDGLWLKRRNNDFGDWLSINADTPKDVLATAYYAYDAHLMAKIAAALGKSDDARAYQSLFDTIRAAFNKAFVTPDGKVKGDTQTAYVLALRFGLLPDNLRVPAAGHLVEDIAQRNNHLSTGFVGVGYLTPTLTQTGHLDVAYRLLNNDTFPSWGYSIKQGATTIWERWDGYTTEKGFQDPGMNSFNHYSLGSVGEWMANTVAGIDLDPDRPGYKHIVLRPRPGGGLTNARAAYDSLYGPIVSDWRLGDRGALAYNITVPANTTATVYVPATDKARVREGGKPAEQADGVAFVRMDGGAAVYTVGSGHYAFTVTP